jgi:glycosyltransferase involved in cell wall biosynthesis
VGTTTGLAGLDYSDDGNALVRDDPGSFAEGVCALIGDESRAARLAAAGRRTAEDRYDWARIGDDYASWLTECAGAGARQ